MENKEKLEKSIYNKFVQGVHIDSINLNDLSIENLAYDIDRRDKLIVDLEFQNEKYDFDKTKLIVNPRFILQVSKEKNEKKTIVFKIEFEYKIEYKIEECEDITKDYVDLFVKRNVPINIWPYARELISSMTTRMGYSALIIEPLKV